MESGCPDVQLRPVALDISNLAPLRFRSVTIVRRVRSECFEGHES